MKFFKTLIFSALAFCIVLFSSCSKDNSDVAASATITATIDGTPTTFDKNVMGASSTFNGANVTSIQGSDAQGNRITISLTGNLIAGKTYSSNAANNDDKPLVFYVTAANTTYATDVSSVSDVIKVKVSAVSSTNAQGAFSGKLTALLDNNDPVFGTKTITDGKFNVSIAK
jgi:hypothetical protein